MSSSLRCAVLLLSLCACVPSDDQLRTLGAVHMGHQARTVAMGLVIPASTAAAACCPSDKHWFDLATAPTVGDVYPDATPEDRYFRGAGALKEDCLTQQGFLETQEVKHRTVACGNVACKGDSADPGPVEVGTASVLLPTAKLTALREHDHGSSWDLAVGVDHLGPVLSEDRQGFSALSVTFQLVEDTTDLAACVIEDRSRAPGPNRKSDYLFERSGGAWH